MASNIGIDLGTTSVKIFMEGKGIVLTEPSAVAYNSDNQIVGIGKRAFDMLEKNPSGIRVVKPMVNGVVSDFTATGHLLRSFIARVCKNAIFKPNVVVCVPSTVTGLERRTILELATASGAARACLIEEPLAAGLGAGLGNDKPKGVMVVDIGGGTADIAVITMGCVSISKSVKSAGNALDEAIIRQLRRERDIIIGEKTAEMIKKRIGSAMLRDVELGMTIKGKNYITNMPGTFEVSSTEIYLAMRPVLEQIIEGVRSVLEETTPDLAADILDSGIYLTGGTALLRSIDKMFSSKLNIKTKVAADPVNCVAMGTGEALGDIEILRHNGYVFKSRAELGGFEDSRGE